MVSRESRPSRHDRCADFQEGTGVRNRVFLFAVLRVGCVVCLASPVDARAERPLPRVARPASSTRPALRVESPGRFVVDQILSPLGRSPLLLLNSRLNLPRRPRVSRSSTPLRQFTLLGGDRFLAEILRWEDNEIELRLRGGQTVLVPRAVVAGISVPNGETELLYESFEPAAASAVTSVIERPTIDAKWLDAVALSAAPHPASRLRSPRAATRRRGSRSRASAARRCRSGGSRSSAASAPR